MSLPQPYADAEYTYLKGTGYNKTHWTLNVRCKGCSQWKNTEGKIASLDPMNMTLPFAHALAAKPVKEPANNRTTFNVHSAFAHWTLNLTEGKNANFDTAVAANLVPDVPPPSSSSPIPSSSIKPTPSTSVIPSTTPGPVQTGIPASCPGVNAFHSNVSTAPGWKAVKVAGNMMQPRGMIFDSAGHLLVIQNGMGITAHTIASNGCFASEKTILKQTNLNHGIMLSQDGKTLYASSATQVYSWDYDATTMTLSNSSKILIYGMDNRGHVTRTLTIPPKHPNLLVVSHGSNDNFDFDSGNIKVGRSCVKVFDVTKIPSGGLNYTTSGMQMGYGLRNGVGLVFDADGM